MSAGEVARTGPALDHVGISGRFNACFASRRPAATLLVGGAAEPVYLPRCGHRPALIRYTRDYARSALHELAHWCLASPEARTQQDYGLWYSPPPRTAPQQARFYAAEIPVQGLEMLLSLACGIEFRFSADNPGADGGPDRVTFERAVTAHCARLQRRGPGAAAETVLTLLNPRWRACPGVGP
ncbi:MAG: elongation factor P hydroxylase [Pseudomonadales bacterium]